MKISRKLLLLTILLNFISCNDSCVEITNNTKYEQLKILAYDTQTNYRLVFKDIFIPRKKTVEYCHKTYFYIKIFTPTRPEELSTINYEGMLIVSPAKYWGVHLEWKKTDKEINIAFKKTFMGNAEFVDDGTARKLKRKKKF